MLQVLLMILKILGILILVILGIILAVLLLVLFVPVRYRGDAAFDGKPGGGVLVSWLMHLVTVRVSYDGKATALVKVLWFRIFDKIVWPAEEESTNTADRADVQAGSAPEDEMDTIAPIEPVSVPKTVDSANTSVTSEAADYSRKTEPASKRTAVSETQMPEVKESEVKESEDKESFISKINNAYQQICGKVNAGQEKVEQVRTFLNDQENRKTIGLLWRQVKKLLRHVLPRKISGRVRFGFDDPAITGQILTYISPFYGLYAKTLKLEPIFEEKVLDGELHVKGHIRAATLLWIVIRVVFNKNFRVLLKKAMALGKK
ncbi:MAG: DUF2953 domain-containing protein [Lachnospiraceae bacterium]|nr:DUF2953 domain-containing protein [Lachnospiraceae bacterium]